MLSDLYAGGILEAAASIPAARRLADAHGSSTKSSRVCGSEVVADIKLENGAISDFGMEARACALGQAAASIVAERIIGTRIDAVFELRRQMRAMLENGGGPPDLAGWEALAMLEPIKDYPQRHASTLLIFDALAGALEGLGYSGNEAGETSVG